MEENIAVIITTISGAIVAIVAVITLFIKSKNKKNAINNNTSENQNTTNINQTINASNAMPVAFGNINGNDTKININTNIQTKEKIELSPIALTILKEISKDEFCELTMSKNIVNFWVILVGSQDFGGKNIEENIIANGAVDELVKFNFIKQTSKSKYQITSNGIDYLKNSGAECLRFLLVPLDDTVHHIS